MSDQNDLMSLAKEELEKIITRIADCNMDGWSLRERTLIQEALKSTYKVKEIISGSFQASSSSEGEFVEVRAKIAVIDDDPILQKIIKSKLEKKGYEVHSFLNPEEALLKLSSIKPDILLLDIMMPQMSGFEVIQKLKQGQKDCNCKIIVASGRQFTRDRLQSLELGASDFLEKPYDVNELLLRIKSLLK